ncbi:MAG: hypothetical protein LC749_08770 [Actinobacteria bacterium]|nr:hypothetical protein [Actinomycetota bacterium]
MSVVVGIKVERSPDRSHDHITGVWTSDGQYRNNRQVARALDAGEKWYSTAGEEQVPIGWVRWCPGMNCSTGPYLVSSGSFQYHVATGVNIRRTIGSPDRLENLPSTGPRPIGSDIEADAVADLETQGVPA